MAEKISVQIALEGGKQIERQLADIGKAGQEAFSDIAKSAEQVGGFKNIKPEEVTKKLKDLGITGVDAINKIQNAVRTAGRLESLVQGVQAAEIAFVGLARAAGVVGVAIAASIPAITKQTINFAEAINKASAEAIKLGVSFEKFDRLRLSLEKMGAPADAIGSGIRTLKQNLDKLDIARFQAIADNLQKLQEKGVRFAPGAAPGLQELIDAAKGLGPVADAAREALVRLGQAAPQAGKFDAVTDAFKRLGIEAGTVDQRLPQIIEKLAAMPADAQRNATAITLLGEALGTLVIQFLNAGGTVDQLKSKLGLLTADQENAANRLVQSLNRLSSAWDRFGSVAFAPTITQGLELIINVLEKLQAAITNISWQTFADAAVAAINLINGAISAFTLQGMISWIARATLAWTGLYELIRRVMSAGAGTPPSLSDTGNVSGGMARGGLLGGRGSGTSDSNLAWVSRGEHIMPARAVRQPGVLAFLEALRRSGGNLRGVLDGMGRFALGGMVPRAMPAFAAGGLAGANLGTLTLGLPSGGSVSVRASSDVVDQLRREAALAQVRSGGRKPSRYS